MISKTLTTLKDYENYFAAFWRIQKVAIDDCTTNKNIAPGTIKVYIKSSLPLFGWDITKLSLQKHVHLQIIIKNDWWFGTRKFVF